MVSKEKEVMRSILRTQLLAIRDLSADCGVTRTAQLFGLPKTLIELLATASTERVLESIDILIKMMACLRLDLSRDETGWLEQALSDQTKDLRPTRHTDIPRIEGLMLSVRHARITEK